LITANELAPLSLRADILMSQVKPKADEAMKKGEPESPFSGEVIPEFSSSIFSRALYTWMTPLIQWGSKNTLSADQVWLTPEEDTSKERTREFLEVYDSMEVSGADVKDRRLLWALFRMRRVEWFLCGGLRVLVETLAFASPLLLRALLKYVESPSSYVNWYPYAVSAGMVGTLMLRVVLFTAIQHVNFSVAFTRRTCFAGAMFRKALTLSYSGKAGSTLGEALNLISTDSNRIRQGSAFAQNAYIKVLSLTLAISLLYSSIGPSAFVGLGVMAVLTPVQTALATDATAPRVAALQVRHCMIRRVLAAQYCCVLSDCPKPGGDVWSCAKLLP
jgi:hypothetical protein